MIDDIKVGDIYEDCNYHPVRCTVVDVEKDFIQGVSLLDGTAPRSCSLTHCGVIKLSEAEAKERIFAFNQGGKAGLMKFNGWSDADIADWNARHPNNRIMSK